MLGTTKYIVKQTEKEINIKKIEINKVETELTKEGEEKTRYNALYTKSELFDWEDVKTFINNVGDENA